MVSFNLPIASQVVGARATRSTHPRVIRDLETSMSALLDERVEVQNPCIWKAKSEMASAIGQSGHVDLLPHTVSCSHVYSMTKLKNSLRVLLAMSRSSVRDIGSGFGGSGTGRNVCGRSANWSTR